MPSLVADSWFQHHAPTSSLSVVESYVNWYVLFFSRKHRESNNILFMFDDTNQYLL